MKACYYSDKKKNPDLFEYRILSNEECKQLKSGASVKILDLLNKIRQVKITSIKTWKTRENFEVHCKYGLYEYFVIELSPDKQNVELIEILS